MSVEQLPDICTSLVKASYTEKIQVLDAVDISERFKRTLPLLMRQIEVSVICSLIHFITFQNKTWKLDLCSQYPGDVTLFTPPVIWANI